MKVRILTHNERRFLTKCIALYHSKTNVQWKALYETGLSRSRIDDLAKNFRKEGLIDSNSYNIRADAIDKVKGLLVHNKDIDKGFHKIWDIVMIVIIGIVVLSIGSIMYSSDTFEFKNPLLGSVGSAVKSNVCESSYFEFKSGKCCLDKNANYICDSDEEIENETSFEF